MANYAHVLDNRVQNVYRGITDPAVELPALHKAGVLVACTALTEPGWIKNGAVLEAPPPPPEPSVTQQRRVALFQDLKTEMTDDEIGVLGAAVSTMLEQLEAVRAAVGTPRTPEFLALVTKVGAVKARLLKAG